MFTITERDRQLARQRAEWDQAVEEVFGDVILKGHPLLTTPAAEFIAASSLEQVLEERTKLLRLRFCKGVRSEYGVHVLVTGRALVNAIDEQGFDRISVTRKLIREVIRRFVAEEISVDAILGPIRHEDGLARKLTLPGNDYYSFYLSY